MPLKTTKTEDYIDVEITCASVGHVVTIRCTKKGIIVCKYPWQKCGPRKANSDRDHCLMTKMVEDIPKEVERLKKEQSEAISKALLTGLLFKKQMEESRGRMELEKNR